MLLKGVIEGFYGRAWSAAQRVEMLDWIAAAEMNAFVYGPKDDVKVRARWRELYAAAELEEIGRLADAAHARDIKFFAAIAPSLDVTYSDPAELRALVARIGQLVGRQIGHFVLLFDDIPREMNQADQASFSSLAAAQAQFANAAFHALRRMAPGADLIFCPTEYCGAFARPDVARSGYLWDLGQLLDPEIKVFWTGPDIVSERIDAASLRQIGAILNRKPVIWDNFHANDYDIRRVYAGPLGGRDDDILPLIEGIITNPNNEFEANFVAVRSTGAWAKGGYDEAAALDAAIDAWQPRFRLAYTEPERHVAREQIRLLTELCHQPFRCGPEVERLLGVARRLLGEHRPQITAEWRAGHSEIIGLRDNIRALFDAMTELENRDLFYAFHPYLWEAREEVTHLCSYLDWLADGPATDAVFPARERIYNFYRRGFSVAVQEMLWRDSEGAYHHVG